MIAWSRVSDVIRGLRHEPEEQVVPGPWLRATAVTAAVATGLVVVSGALDLGFPHRALVLVALAPLVALVVAARLAYRRLAALATAGLGLVLADAVVGGIVVLAGRTGWSMGLHLVIGGLAFAAVAGAAGLAFRGASVAGGPWRDYVTLTKPRIMVLLLITAVGGAFVAAHGFPSWRVLLLTVVGGALASGGASALNHVMDRDIDPRMGPRTAGRPVASRRVPSSYALEFGLALSALSFALLASLVNVLAALLALAGNLFYVLVYTGWLKRTTPQNIVIGGAAGAVPPLVGWAAATGHLSLPALFLFLIVFFWTPPHFWALALLIKKNYAAAGVPMLPVVRGERETTRQIVWYSLVLVGISLLPAAWGGLGAVYLTAALLLGAGFLFLAWRLRADASTRRAGALFHYSLAYLAALFVAMAVAPLV